MFRFKLMHIIKNKKNKKYQQKPIKKATKNKTNKKKSHKNKTIKKKNNNKYLNGPDGPHLSPRHLPVSMLASSNSCPFSPSIFCILH